MSPEGARTKRGNMKSKLLRAVGLTAALALPVGGLTAMTAGIAGASTPGTTAHATLAGASLACVGTSTLPATELKCMSTTTGTTTAPHFTTITIWLSPVPATDPGMAFTIYDLSVNIDNLCTVTFNGTLHFVYNPSTGEYDVTPSPVTIDTTTPTPNVTLSGTPIVCGIVTSYINGKTFTITISYS
jgi:hypothetical protein